MTYTQASQAYDAALAAWERSPTDANKRAHDRALAALLAARRIMDANGRTQRALAQLILSGQR